MPYFPPKLWFQNKSPQVLETRRRFLENYLQRVLDLCKSLPQCPLNYHSFGYEHLTRQCLYDLNSFFVINTLVDKQVW